VLEGPGQLAADADRIGARDDKDKEQRQQSEEETSA